MTNPKASRSGLEVRRERAVDPGDSARAQAQQQIADQVAQRTAKLVSVGIAQLRKFDAIRAAERELVSANARLQREVEGLGRTPTDSRLAHARIESAFNNAPIGMAIVAMDDRCLQVNEALCRITGYREEALTAMTLRSITHPDDVELEAQSLAQLLAGRISSYQVEKRLRDAWGHHVWVLVTASIVRDENRKPLHLVTLVQDITERRELSRHLEYCVDHDFLTGLFNRRHFEQELAKETERVARYGSPGAVLVIDLDNFKEINDTFGHPAGDDVLKRVAGVLKERLRQTDIVARIGGDEFAVLLPRADAERAQSVAEDLVKALGRQTAVLADDSIRITASIGVTPFDGLSDVEVLAYADLAMYEAKETGRNRSAVYRPVVEEKKERGSARLAEAERIRNAIEEDRLILYGQPILDLRTNEVCQYELLLRLPDDRKGEPLPPSAFLYSAERFGLMQAIDGWVVNKAVALIAEHQRAGRSLALNVNLSGKSVGDRKLATLIEAALTESGIDAGRLNFELTETSAIANLEEARTFAGRLRGRGCHFSLGDFGAGLGSFTYLKNFPFDCLKIDGDFVRGLASSPVDQLVVKAIVEIARGMGKKTVAEFVADEKTADLLREIGVDCAQGHHIGVPRPVSEVLSV